MSKVAAGVHTKFALKLARFIPRVIHSSTLWSRLQDNRTFWHGYQLLFKIYNTLWNSFHNHSSLQATLANFSLYQACLLYLCKCPDNYLNLVTLLNGVACKSWKQRIPTSNYGDLRYSHTTRQFTSVLSKYSAVKFDRIKRTGATLSVMGGSLEEVGKFESVEQLQVFRVKTCQEIFTDVTGSKMTGYHPLFKEAIHSIDCIWSLLFKVFHI